ncbi:hypothetical protein WOLCODRAFT_155782 [Wolfiporia cocos MD-104 SS10]|uniref:Uncharacterized protein n=1 Tax=Wolfiporia cocos (strain MD-104) TaxID=742152 RepID=A0A2H3IZG0_WOLCO|nr:hypothetical protein WOLCODRAFT_155782 [Wolfiporia cocos MD-104 SS10]
MHAGGLDVCWSPRLWDSPIAVSTALTKNRHFLQWIEHGRTFETFAIDNDDLQGRPSLMFIVRRAVSRPPA